MYFYLLYIMVFHFLNIFFSTKMGEFVVSAGTAEKRMYWLQQLQKARREFSAGGASAVRHSVMPHQVNVK